MLGMHDRIMEIYKSTNPNTCIYDLVGDLKALHFGHLLFLLLEFLQFF